jgi:predicted  nucleic acid-binding Zn-ribbon protein
MILYCLQAQQRRILQLEGEVEAMRVESGRQQEALIQQRSQTRAAEARIQELQQELENNAGAAHLGCKGLYLQKPLPLPTALLCRFTL